MENITYYTIIRVLHFIGMAAWFGTALAVNIIWSKKQTGDVDLVSDLITKVEMPASVAWAVAVMVRLLRSMNCY